MKLSLSCLLLASSLCAASAHAATITSATVYTGIPDVNNADDSANKTSSSANFSIGSTGINYSTNSSSAAASSLAAYLNNPTFSNATASFSSAGTPTSIEVIITGTIQLTAGEILSVTHDDGADLYLNGVEVITSPAQTVAITNTYSGESAGLYNFTLNYAANSLEPSVLEFKAGGTDVAPTPEPSSLILLGTGLASAAGFARRRFSRAV